MSTSARPSVLVVHEDPTGPDCPVDALRDVYDIEMASDHEEAIESLREGVDVAILEATNADATEEIDLVERIREARIDCQVALLGAVGDGTRVEPDVDVLLPESADSSDLRKTVEQLCAIAAYEEAKRQLSSLRVRRNVRRMELSVEEQRANTDFKELCDRIDELETELEALRGRIDDPRLLDRIEG